MKNTEVKSIVIVGGGQAGLHAAVSLRRRGFCGTVTIISEETPPPYQRPPLSKAFLKDEFSEERLALKPKSFYHDQQINLSLGVRATHIDRGNRCVHTNHNTAFQYDHLILATGSRPRLLPIAGADYTGCHVLRSVEDAKEFRNALRASNRVVIIGGGYIGLEAASAAREMGLCVCVLERTSNILSRVTSAPVSQFFKNLHERKGVAIHCNTTVVELIGDSGQINAVRLNDGRIFHTDTVLVGVGVLPNEELAVDANIECRDGILVDENGVSSDPDIYAVGDCARRKIVGYKNPFRLESVHNALDSAERVAASILELESLLYDPPWFWSDQYDVKLQSVGLCENPSGTVIRGSPDDGNFSVFYYRNDDLLAVDAINDPGSFLAAKRILKSGGGLPPDVAANTKVSLKNILPSGSTRKTVS